MKSKVYRYMGVVLVIIGVVLSATGMTTNEDIKDTQKRYPIETIDALDEKMQGVSNEGYDDKVINTGIGYFIIILGTFFLTGHYLLIHRDMKSTKKSASE